MNSVKLNRWIFYRSLANHAPTIMDSCAAPCAMLSLRASVSGKWVGNSWRTALTGTSTLTPSSCGGISSPSHSNPTFRYVELSPTEFIDSFIATIRAMINYLGGWRVFTGELAFCLHGGDLNYVRRTFVTHPRRWFENPRASHRSN